ncbi:S1 RNA-binding domain-containing protein 1 [Lycorma delicatula]|uniref:S1 RNA-binding domain-containing protein 1 n=1 Tax=Lycorma delicatula TaxID=130591 RepID=UPI003F50E52E
MASLDSSNSSDLEEPIKKRSRKRKISDDEDEDWVPEEKTSEVKKKVKTEKPPPKKCKNDAFKIKEHVNIEKEPKNLVRVKKEPGVKVKKEPGVKVKKEPGVKVKKEPGVKVKKEIKPKIKTEIKVKDEIELKIKTETKFEDDENDLGVLSNDEKPYEVPNPAWEPADLLAEMIELDIGIARNIVRLFENDNTIPFIARYRKELTGNMDPEMLRNAKDSYETIKGIQTKQSSILKMLNKSGKLCSILEQCVLGARSFSELEHIYAPYKVGSKRTKAEAARQIGLEPPAVALLHGTEFVKLEPLINYEIDGLTTLSDIENGVSYIIADIISKDKNVLDTLRKLQKDAHIRIETKSRAAGGTSEKSKVNGKNKDKKVKNENSNQNKEDLEGKYQNYFNFSTSVRYIRPHQVLAINRGENQKILSVKFIVPDWLMHRLQGFCRGHFLSSGFKYPLRMHIFEKSFKDAYSRLIHPLVVRSVRAELNKEAERASIEVFAANLKKLLLMPPLRGKVVMAIDPGFHHGCKIAVTAQNGSVLDTAILHFNFMQNVNPKTDKAAAQLKEMLIKHNCETVALGNGTACRQTETYLGKLIQSGWFMPLDVKYTIISETGASIYSCSPEAAKEFPNMDPNLISAVSLARRLQDPLGELVKVEPKHLGVGMYQHDVSEKQLSSTLDEVVSECVSFVGVDINTASHTVLRRVAGLNASRATKLIEWREGNGPFTNRQQLRLVKGIGDKSFEQCAGFVRILPQSFHCSRSQSSFESESNRWPKKHKTIVETEVNPLDRTWIHPEMYIVANRFILKCGAVLNQLGVLDFIKKINQAVTNIGIQKLAEELGVSESQVIFISEGLQQPPDYDLRSSFSEPLFRRSFASLEDLQVGSLLTGRIENVTHFGSFVDIGVGKAGLIPAQRMKTIIPQLGDRVEVKVISIELQRKRITLDLVKLL